jgi:hypothetical protein
VSELALQHQDLERLSVALDGSVVLRSDELPPAPFASPSALVDVQAGGAEAAVERLFRKPLEPTVAATKDVLSPAPPRH